MAAGAKQARCGRCPGGALRAVSPPGAAGNRPACRGSQVPRQDDARLRRCWRRCWHTATCARSNASLMRLFSAMDGIPTRFVSRFDYPAARRALSGFKHRFTDAEGHPLPVLASRAFRQRMSLEQAFSDCCGRDDPDHAPAAARFVHLLLSQDFGPHFRAAACWRSRRSSTCCQTPRAAVPANASTCFCGGLVRPDDGIDLGLWPKVDPRRLLMPSTPTSCA